MLGLSRRQRRRRPGRDLARARTSAGARRSGRSPCSALLTVALVAGVRARAARATARPPAAASCGAFTQPQVWLTLLAGAIGFGGMFAVYTYIAPTVTEVGGLPESAVPVFLLVLRPRHGRRHLAGRRDWPTGRSSARCSIGSVGMGVRAAAVLRWLAPYGWWALPVVFLITALGSVLVVNLQLRLMDVAGDAQTLGAAMNHASLNVANALGAWLGGLVIAAGCGYRAPAAGRRRAVAWPAWSCCWCRRRCTVAAPPDGRREGIPTSGEQRVTRDDRIVRSGTRCNTCSTVR